VFLWILNPQIGLVNGLLKALGVIGPNWLGSPDWAFPSLVLMSLWSIGGSVIIETIFAIPGMGQLFYQSVMARDYPMIQGMLLLGSALTLLGNLLADLAYAVVDPRIRHGRT
ncbi:MAG: ABC transporter permease subunit, partial [Proteobacteria bacterium]|nr:ABC transporter permease subunit [Pseudomonadota bacterium]